MIASSCRLPPRYKLAGNMVVQSGTPPKLPHDVRNAKRFDGKRTHAGGHRMLKSSMRTAPLNTRYTFRIPSAPDSGADTGT